jgi:hypothetical protein
MPPKLNAEFRCERNDDGTCGAKIVVEGQEDNERWELSNGDCEALEVLYIDFVMEHLFCPAVHDGCATCLSRRFMERLKTLGLYCDAPDDD